MAFENTIKKAVSLDNISKNIDGALDIAKRVLSIGQPVKDLINTIKPGNKVGPSVESNVSQQGAAADKINPANSIGSSAIFLLIIGALLIYFLKR